MVTRAGVRAQAPGVVIQRTINPTLTKWTEYWNDEKNKEKCLGENFSVDIVKQVALTPEDTIYDFGCGTGRGGLVLSLLTGATTILVDHAPNCLDEDVAKACITQSDKISFLQHDLYNPLFNKVKFGLLAGVFEHLESIDELTTIFKNCTNVVEKLYLLIELDDKRDYKFWHNVLKSFNVVIFSCFEADGYAHFFTSRWLAGEEVQKLSGLNNDIETVAKNIAINVTKGFSQIEPHLKQDREVVLLAGGPSLNDFVEDIKEKRRNGAALVTVNGSYNWAIQQGLKPSAQIVVDSRAFNKKFLTPIIQDCKYLIASQCDPSLFDDMPKNKTLIWHATIPQDGNLDIEKYYEVWYPILGGSTSILRSFYLLRLLGYYNFHVYGFDSCYIDDKHHAYEQQENNTDGMVAVTLGDRIFKCAPWMVCQAQEFMAQTQAFGDEINMAVYGDGLIANIILAATQEN